MELGLRENDYVFGDLKVGLSAWNTARRHSNLDASATRAYPGVFFRGGGKFLVDCLWEGGEVYFFCANTPLPVDWRPRFLVNSPAAKGDGHFRVSQHVFVDATSLQEEAPSLCQQQPDKQIREKRRHVFAMFVGAELFLFLPEAMFGLRFCHCRCPCRRCCPRCHRHCCFDRCISRSGAGNARQTTQFGGNAQAITKGRWLHHTSFLWSFDPANMLYLQMPEKRVRGLTYPDLLVVRNGYGPKQVA